jgi:hypothetical protein
MEGQVFFLPRPADVTPYGASMNMEKVERDPEKAQKLDTLSTFYTSTGG